jgi:hypothetical protein
VADQYLRECLQMLVNNFTPPGPLIRYIEEPRWFAKKEEIYSQLQASLKKISDTVPLAPRMLKDIIDRSMPKLFDNIANLGKVLWLSLLPASQSLFYPLNFTYESSYSLLFTPTLPLKMG